jgi:prophage regulatory protein
MLLTSDQIKAPKSPQPLHVLQIADALLKVQTVSAVTGISVPTIYRKMAAGQFPAAVRLGSKCTRWRAGDVMDWLRAQAAGAKGAA